MLISLDYLQSSCQNKNTMKNDFTRCNSHWRFVRRLRENDWFYGSPHHASGEIKSGEGNTAVFISPCGKRAMRINHGMWRDFALYVDVARAQPHNPYFQNIYDAFFLDDGTYCVELERLHDITPRRDKRKSMRKGEHPVSTRCQGEYIITQNLLSRCMKSNRPESVRRRIDKDSALRDAISALFSTVDRAHDQDDKFDLHLDLHGGNFMARLSQGREDVVITDPYTYVPYMDEYSEPPCASQTYWRRRLGMECHNKDWDMHRTRCGYGLMTLK
jgi:hypothetical protein